MKLPPYEARLVKLLLASLVVLAIVITIKALGQEPVTVTPRQVELPVSPHAVGIADVESASLPEEQVLSATEPLVVYYDVPLSVELQDHIFALCDEYTIDPALIIAIIFRESTYRTNAVNGTSYGLMQVNQPYHTERMRHLGAADLFDPFDNVTVGIDILAEEIARHDTLGEALTAYNAGATGAYELYFSRGITANTYAKNVLKTYRELSYGTLN